MTKHLYCILGPSGSGKSTLSKSLTDSGYTEVRSHTTRKCRGGSDVDAYHFVSKEGFMALVESGEMFEYVDYCGNFYGTSYVSLDQGDFILVDPKGLESIRNGYHDRRVFAIGLNASTAELKRRLSARNDDSPNRVEADKELFHNLSARVDCYIVSRSIQATAEIALDFIRECEEAC